MFGVGFFELVIIAVVALVVVGPKRLPEVMRQAGRMFVHLRRTANDVRSTFEQVIRDAEDEMRREEAQSIRQSLQPVVDARDDVHKLLTDQHTPPASNGDVNQTATEQQPSAAPAPAPELQPHGAQPYNPNKPG
jgi:sec-independent protein translocase protein TatB